MVERKESPNAPGAGPKTGYDNPSPSPSPNSNSNANLTLNENSDPNPNPNPNLNPNMNPNSHPSPSRLASSEVGLSEATLPDGALPSNVERRVSGLDPVRLMELVEEARRVRAFSHSPYSRYPVGAALLADDGQIYSGVNVENAAWGTLCAEINAVGSAVAAGARRFLAVAVCAERNSSGRSVMPCGNCRQMLAEFGLDLQVVSAAPSDDNTTTHRLRELLPYAFSEADL